MIERAQRLDTAFGRSGAVFVPGIPYEETVTIFETASGRLLDAAPENAHRGV